MHFITAIILVLAYTTAAAESSLEDAFSAYDQNDYARAARLLRPLADQG